ncbi:class I SAM-dependent DNA methyltransferase [Streptomyces sp. NPDC058417]|uniref:class I SAM-dependent DNA methyltransferase n=1 Tax=unclassified Streptomyces TaxID=2593676 RepID=UPI00365A85FE
MTGPIAAHASAEPPAASAEPPAEPGFVADTRAFYDTVAEDYYRQFHDVLARLPTERAVLGLYAELVGGGGRVADLGCGPGEVTGLLAALGLDVWGLDLSASMLAIARRGNPGLRFERGSMLDLAAAGVADGSLDGVVCWYSSLHTPTEELPRLFAGFRRVLAPGGHLLVAFQVGDEPKRHERPWGHPVSLDFRRRRPGTVTALLTAAGFSVRSTTVRAPETGQGEAVPQAYVVARAE